jgi:hypothetical protein
MEGKETGLGILLVDASDEEGLRPEGPTPEDPRPDFSEAAWEMASREAFDAVKNNDPSGFSRALRNLLRVKGD